MADRPDRAFLKQKFVSFLAVYWTIQLACGWKHLATRLECLLESRRSHAVWARIPPAPSPAQLAAVAAACQQVDALSAVQPVPTASALISSLRPILSNLSTALAPQGAAGVAPGPAAPPQPRSFEQIGAEVRLLSGATWLIFGALATALGTYVLVLSNVGFGVPTDYLVCLFWGFGLPVGGTQLVQSTVGSASTALGFSIPK